MSAFKVSKHFRNIPAWQQTGARIQLAHWLKKNGHKELAGQVSCEASSSALNPHLAEVDKVLPSEVTREQIFPKVFTDPLTIRAELTAMIGESVRHYPREDELSIDDKMSILGELKNQIEEVGKRTKFTKEIAKLLKSDRSAQDFEDRLDALIIEAGGYLTGLKGYMLDESIVDVSKKYAERTVDKNIYGALSFLDLVERQVIRAQGRLKKNERETADAFILGASKVWTKPLRFVEKLSSYWGKATSEIIGEISGSLSENIGHVVSQITEPRLRLGLAAKLSKTMMLTNLHLLEVEKFIYARGWLKGHAEYNEDKGTDEWVSSLRKNALSIIGRALTARNPSYVVQAAKALPKIVEDIKAKAEELDDDLSNIFLSNKGTMISRSLRLGYLEKYPKAVSEAFPKMVDRITAKAKELDDELASVLLSNKRSIISHAIDSGKLEKYPQMVFEALPKMDDAITAMVEELDDVLGEILISNKWSIIYHAINSGMLEKYPQIVVEALPKMMDKISSKAEELDGELATVLLKRKTTIISRAISTGMLEKYLLEVFEALPKIADAIEAKAGELDDELASALLSNKGSIIIHSIRTGKLEKYPQDVFKALPKIIDAITEKAEELDDEIAEAIQARKGTLIRKAIQSGRLEKDAQEVLEAIPKMFDAITEKAKELDKALAEILLSTRGTTISFAIRSGKLEKYLQEVFEALPQMVDGITVRARELDDELAEVIRSNRGSIINHAIHSGKLESYVEAVCEAIPRIAPHMDRTSLNIAIKRGNIDSYDKV